MGIPHAMSYRCRLKLADEWEGQGKAAGLYGWEKRAFWQGKSNSNLTIGALQSLLGRKWSLLLQLHARQQEYRSIEIWGICTLSSLSQTLLHATDNRNGSECYLNDKRN